jgi:hypothetical protein
VTKGLGVLMACTAQQLQPGGAAHGQGAMEDRLAHCVSHCNLHQPGRWAVAAVHEPVAMLVHVASAAASGLHTPGRPCCRLYKHPACRGGGCHSSWAPHCWAAQLEGLQGGHGGGCCEVPVHCTPLPVCRWVASCATVHTDCATGLQHFKSPLRQRKGLAGRTCQCSAV